MPNKILSVLIFLIALAGFNLYGWQHDWFGSATLRLLSNLIPFNIVMPIGPLIFLYVKSTLNDDFRWQKKDKIPFTFAIIDLVSPITAIIFVLGVLFNVIQNNPGPWGRVIDAFNFYADIPRWISISVYTLFSFNFISAQRKKINNPLYTIRIKWLWQVVVAFLIFQIIWLIYLIPYYIPGLADQMLAYFGWYPIYIPLAVMIYWLGLKGYLTSFQYRMVKKEKQIGPVTDLDPAIEQIVLLLREAMEKDKIFLNPDLDLKMLSTHTNVPQKIISEILNQYLNISFSVFINQYRINEFKRKILQPDAKRLTLAGVAFECGFSSQATFQRLFKQYTGESPSAFKDKALDSSL
ncbi:helix-turn-helix domain-containing protein [Pedobacter frigoris]|uniref:helix-turn-helix domain-containing protein n=1 Tax=Pedobacter frigoris TaxID=2571272 RepID=UPI002930874C|nr:helix-turn-helix domain-containing protein [Pedobacter frigoris]